MIYPKFLNPGDTIGICAPSAGVGYKLDSFDKSLSVLKGYGYKIVETPSVRVDNIRSADAITRANEYHSLLEDNSINAIIAASGGEFCIEMLPYLNKETIQNNPKWLCGYSDPTNIQYYLTTKLDISTVYGFNAGGFDWPKLHKFQQVQLDILAGKIDTQYSYDFFDSCRTPGQTEYHLDTPVKWELYNNSESTLNVQGRLIGGCTDVISSLIGTPYDGTIDFIKRYYEDGTIWYFDTFEMSPLNLFCTIKQFRYAGYFDNAKAIIFGRVMYPGDATDNDYVDLLKSALEGIPFTWGADIGHTKPAMTIINGSLGTLSFQNNKATLNMELK